MIEQDIQYLMKAGILAGMSFEGRYTVAQAHFVRWDLLEHK